MEADHIVVRQLQAVSAAQVGELAQVLIDCVEGGASVSFMLPLTGERAMAFWQRVADDVAAGRRALMVAEEAGQIVGTVQLVLEQPENQPHRADLAKMLVLRRLRRRGVGLALMRAAERAALQAGKSLLVLDTSNDDAARLYSRLGWQHCGTVPDYALWPGGGLCATHFFYRRLAADAAAPA